MNLSNPRNSWNLSTSKKPAIWYDAQFVKIYPSQTCCAVYKHSQFAYTYVAEYVYSISRKDEGSDLINK